MTQAKNRFNLSELAGAFGDLGTLIPFVVAYVSILKMDPASLFLGFGATLIAAGLYYRTPFPVQPMKAIGAAAVTQTAGVMALTPSMVIGAGLVTALLWLLLGLTGLAKRLATARAGGGRGRPGFLQGELGLVGDHAGVEIDDAGEDELDFVAVQSQCAHRCWRGGPCAGRSRPGC